MISSIAREQIGLAVEILFEAWHRYGTVFSMGNGGSASTATHFAGDQAKLTIVPGKKRLKAVALMDNIPLVCAWTNGAGFSSIFAGQVEPRLKSGQPRSSTFPASTAALSTKWPAFAT